MKKIVFILTIFSPAIGFNQIPVKRQLHGTIIRSSTVEGDRALIGLKGKGPGSGIVYYSENSLKGWIPTNNGLAIAPEVEDVQAVALVNDTIFLAGTWKNGLFRTIDKGKTWKKITSFPSNDIRSIAQTRTKIYAATTTHGVVASADNGKTWTICSDSSYFKQTASWSLEPDPADQKSLYALSFRSGIQKSEDEGKTWKQLISHEGMMFSDLVFSESNSNTIYAIGGNDSLGVIYRSRDSGENWEMLTKLPQGSLNQIALTGENHDILIIGSWDRGVHIYSGKKWGHIDEITFETVANIVAMSKEIVIFSWGDGIFKIPNDWVNK